MDFPLAWPTTNSSSSGLCNRYCSRTSTTVRSWSARLHWTSSCTLMVCLRQELSCMSGRRLYHSSRVSRANHQAQMFY
uniref:Uncharacterized protein n=1 Tax=Aegilops tauschii subsp. strangulata TaxID=200361 RepID=A0A453K4H9_AEGTS